MAKHVSTFFTQPLTHKEKGTQRPRLTTFSHNQISRLSLFFINNFSRTCSCIMPS
uniref:Uncharacterized protein n=1 Tax=Rhizophora mucronata TaxID=61149 RepID=A0A2P2NVW2_RHIMU